MPFGETHWSGGDPANGYFGIAGPSADARERIAAFFWQ